MEGPNMSLRECISLPIRSRRVSYLSQRRTLDKKEKKNKTTVQTSLMQYTDTEEETTNPITGISSQEESELPRIQSPSPKEASECPMLKNTSKMEKSKKKEKKEKKSKSKSSSESKAKKTKTKTHSPVDRHKQKSSKGRKDDVVASPLSTKPVSISSRGSAVTLMTSTTISTSPGLPVSPLYPLEKKKAMLSSKQTTKSGKSKHIKKAKVWNDTMISAPPFSPMPHHSTTTSVPSNHQARPSEAIDNNAQLQGRDVQVAPRRTVKETIESAAFPFPLSPMSQSLNSPQPTQLMPSTRPTLLSPSVPTELRVKAARDFLNSSLHEPPPPRQTNYQRPRLQTLLSGDSLTSIQGQNHIRVMREQLASLSLERKSLHEAKHSLSQDPAGIIFASRKMAKRSRLSKLRQIQRHQQRQQQEQHEETTENHSKTELHRRDSQELHDYPPQEQCLVANDKDPLQSTSNKKSKRKPPAISVEQIPRCSLRILQVIETSLHSLAAQETQSTTHPPGDDDGCSLSVETEDDVQSFADSSHSGKWYGSEESESASCNNIVESLPVITQSKEAVPPQKSLAPKASKDTLSSVSASLRHCDKTMHKLSKPSSCETSHSHHIMTDLQGFLNHLTLLNDLKALTDPASDMVEPGHSDSFPKNEQCTKYQRFQQMFRLKCALFSILHDDDSAENLERKRRILLQNDVLSPSDLDLVLEHIKLCEHECLEIRWDLIRTIFFPKDAVALPEKRVTIGNLIEHQARPMVDFHSSMAVGFGDATIPNRTVYLAHGHSSTDFSGMGNTRISLYEDDELSFWSPREEFQEDILELFESAEAVMEDLPFEQRQERRLVLVQLLQATSEEEAHFTNISLDDMAEIVRHLRICKETETEVQWEMIRDIVFPLGVGVDYSRTNTCFHGSWESEHNEIRMGNQSNFYQSFSSLESLDHKLLKSLDHPKKCKNVLRDLFDLAGHDLDVVLQHIHECRQRKVPIRWDLIGKVLFPGDQDRQKIVSSSR